MILPRLPDQPRRGTTMVLVAVFLTVIVGVAAFAVDLGMVTLLRSQIQNAVDAAALAAVLQLNQDPSAIEQAENLAREYVQRNRVGTLVTVPEDAIDVQRGVFDPATRQFTATNTNPNAVRVFATQRNEPFYFARIFGYDTYSMPASAVASAGEVMDIMLVLDLSMSMTENGRIQALWASAPAFVDTIAAFGSRDQIGVMGLAAFPNTYNPVTFKHPTCIEYQSGLHPTNDHMVGVLERKLTSDFASLKSTTLTSTNLKAGKYYSYWEKYYTYHTGTGAALGDAVHYLLHGAESRPVAAKAIVLMTDGMANRPTNNGPGYALQMAQYAAANDIPVYTISLGDYANTSLNEEIATISGGSHYDATGDGQVLLTQKLTTAFQHAAGDLKRAQLVK
jgi:Mg-chelatase subunit ChlD